LIHPAAHLARQRERAIALRERLARVWRHRLAYEQRAVETLCGRLVRELRAPLPQSARVALAIDRWRRRARERIARHASRLAALGQNLEHLNPEAVLTRGYAIVTTPGGTVVFDAAQVAPADSVKLAFGRGRADATIIRTDS
jgi:exodeoxyribonuclease VII large subunit